MMRRLLVAIAALIALLLTLLVPQWAFAAGETIRLWHGYRGDEEKALEQIVASFQGPRVEILAVPYDAYAAKLQAAISIGEGPDVFIDAHERLGDFRARGIVAPVGDALESEAVFNASALDAVRAEGAIWGLPLSQKCVALFLNTDLAKEPPAFVEDLVALRQQLPEGVYPLAYEAKNAYAHAPFLAAFGGSLLTPSDDFGFVGPQAEASLDFAKDLIAKGVVPDDADGSLVTSLFRAGKAAYVINGPWLAADLGAASEVHYRVTPLPRVRATGELLRPLLTVEAAMLSPKGAAKANARALARLIAGAEGAKIRGTLARTVTARTDVPLPAGDELLKAFAEQAKNAVPMPSSQAMRSVWEPANRAIRKVLRGDADAKTALDEARHRYDDVRRPLPEPASPTPALVLVGLLFLAAAFSMVRSARKAEFRVALKRSLPIYRYVLHAVLAVGLLVLAPLVVGAGTSLFAGSGEDLRYVGLANFFNILTARGGPLLASGSFYLVLIVTVCWAVINVAFHLGIGLLLGIILARPTLRLRALYRVLLIIPWAVPSYVTALAWKGMFHRQYGAITGIILSSNELFGTHMQPISWFAKFSTAFTANIITNVWLGFPFMMVVTMGALTNVPDDVLEAAEVDGATRWQKLWHVTLPMIRPVLTPAVTLGAIWTFNMFNVVFLVSGGDPDGTTDILVSEAYRWAFTREAQYGYAAAYSVLIFVLLFGSTRLSAWRRERSDQREKALAVAAGTA